MKSRFTVPALALALAAPIAAQGSLPALFLPDPGVRPNGTDTVSFTVSGLAGHNYAVLWDVDSGPFDLFGETFFLGFTPALVQVVAGTFSVTGEDTFNIGVPADPSLDGTLRHLQAFEIDPAAPNGVFRASNPASFAVHDTTDAIVDSFTNAALAGFTGNFDTGVSEVLQGGAIRVRTHRTVDLSQGLVFPQPLQTPLNPNGSRCQIVYRPQDVGATGEEEVVTAVRWRPLGGQVFQDSFPQFEMALSHSAVMPDFSLDLFSSLPMFPNSGLDPVFSQNVIPGETPTSVFSGSYSISPSNVTPDGYVPYPTPTSQFCYNGVDSLLLDLKMAPSSAVGLNGQTVRLMVLSSALPAARNVANGTPQTPLDPNTATTGTGDNSMYDYQIEFTRVKTSATSPWRAGAPGADYRTPLVASIEPAGTSVEIEYRGADDGLGANPTAWSTSVDIADGRSFLQYRITLVGDIASGAVPSVDSLVIPF